ncbi:MAG: SCO family protein [Wenzhouxiangellaceae bacterium]|nr:SCO family protein [Wenzhouxiangellaceae bacterium]
MDYRVAWMAPVFAGLMLGVAGNEPLAAGEKDNYLVSQREYELPDVTLVDTHGRPVPARSLAGDGERTIVSFIFTSCAGICPMITANMVRAVPELDDIRSDYRIVLISVDPEFDTPRRLAEYAERFRAGSKIEFLTGSSRDVFKVLRSMDAHYEGDNKMNHQPVTLISLDAPGRWLRIDGLIGSEVLVEQYRDVVTTSAGQAS